MGGAGALAKPSTAVRRVRRRGARAAARQGAETRRAHRLALAARAPRASYSREAPALRLRFALAVLPRRGGRAQSRGARSAAGGSWRAQRHRGGATPGGRARRRCRARAPARRARAAPYRAPFARLGGVRRALAVLALSKLKTSGLGQPSCRRANRRSTAALASPTSHISRPPGARCG